MGTKEADAVSQMVKAMLAERLDKELAGRIDAWQGLFESIDTSLSSLVEAAENSGGKALADALSKAFSQIKMPAAAAPQQLPAPQVTVEPRFSVPAAPPPQIVMPPSDATFEVEFKYGNGGRLIGMTVVRKSAG